jgi:signal transduction histidine kinase
MNTTQSTNLPLWRRPRWQFALGGFLLGVVYTLIALVFGFRFQWGDADVTLLGGAVVELSFAGFGYLLGLVLEARRQESQHLRDLAATRGRLAQAEKLATLGQMAGAVSHEVRTPLAILRSMAQNLEEVTPGEGRETCRQMLEEIDRLARVTARLVDFARPVEPRRRRTSASEIGERAALLAREGLRARPLNLVSHPGPDAPLEADPDLVCQVLLGLMDNAATASREGGEITLAWDVPALDIVEFRVMDTGSGVPGHLREKIFEPFFTTRADGHGLGLAVARQIAEAHGGRLTVANSESVGAGSGAVFLLRLPAHAALESAA